MTCQLVLWAPRAGAAGLLLGLAACGGGGGSGAPVDVPAPLPASLSITAPEQAPWQAAVAFDSSLPATAAGLRYEWQFGDGAASTDAKPSHSYASAGDYEVTLVVSNAQGASITAKRKLSVQAWANLRGAACSQRGVGGWCRIGVDAAAPAISTVYMADATQAWASTEFGDLWRTRDAGKTWQAVSTVPNGATGLYFQDARTGWLATNPEGTAGSDTAVWRTTDGGASFATVLPDVPALGAYQVRVLGGDRLMAESQLNGATLGSVAGGATWRANPARSFTMSSWSINLPILPPASRVGRLWRLNGNTVELTDDAGLTSRAAGVLPAACQFGVGYASLSLSPAAQLLAVSASTSTGTGSYLTQACYSADGGANWAPAAPGLAQPGGVFFDAASFIGDTGAVIRDGAGFLWSDPLGSPWQRVAVDRAFNSLSRLGFVDAKHVWAQLASGESVSSPSTVGPQTLFMADNLTWTGFLPTAPDLTRSYQYRIQSTIGDASFNRAFDAQRGLQLWRGKLYRTEDNGASFTGVSLAGAEPVPVASTGAGAFLNVKQGFVVSAQGALLQSSDGGATWAASATVPAGAVYNVWAGPEQSLWISGAFTEQGVGVSRLLRSVDGGKTWEAVFKGPVLSVQFISRSQGWLHTGAQVYRSADLGQTWQAAGALASQNMQMLDATRGVAGYARYAGSSNPAVPCLQTTEDGGASWSPCAVPQVASGSGLLGVAAAAGSFWLFNSDGLHRSNDFGKTWTRVALPGPALLGQRLNALAFADARQGWAVSALGGIWATADGGQTWALQPSGTSADLRRLSVVDSRAIWAFGARTVLGTATGGR